jgi:hypothetical protein
MVKATLLGSNIDRKLAHARDYEFEKARTREELLEMLHEPPGAGAIQKIRAIEDWQRKR